MKRVIYTKSYSPATIEEIKADVKREFGHLTLLEQKRKIKSITERYLSLSK